MAGFDYAEMNAYSPEGKLGQFEYAMRATELGNTCLSIKNKKIGIMMAHNPKRSLLAEPIKKVFNIQKNTLFSFSGITNDGLCIVDYLRDYFLTEKVGKQRLANPLYAFDYLTHDMAHTSLVGSSRLCGASGILLCEYNKEIHCIELIPNKKAKEVHGSAIGYRNQSCKTILTNKFEEFIDENCCTAEQMIRVGIRAMLNAHPINSSSGISSSSSGEGKIENLEEEKKMSKKEEESKLKPEDLEIYLIEVGKDIQRIDGAQYFE